MTKTLTVLAIAATFLGCVFIGCENVDEVVNEAVEDIEQEAGHHDGPSTPNVSSVSIVSKGNPNVSNAKEDPNVQIKGLKINGRSGLSYSFSKNDLGQWGYAKDQTDGIAVAGYLDGSSYVCRKFDWISSSRHTRDFKNINTGYNGWEPEKFYSAKKHCFFIMSKDGKKRTNIITD